MKKYYTKSKSGEEVEVSPELAKQLVSSGKKTASDFTIEDSGDKDTQPTSVTSTPEYKSVYGQLKEDALRVGYSGLTDIQKKMIRDAYPESIGGKAGRPFEEMTAKMDEQAGRSDYTYKQDQMAGRSAVGPQNPDQSIPERIYGDLRTSLSNIVSPATAVIQKIFETTTGEDKHILGHDVYGNEISIPKSEVSFNDRIAAEREAGYKGEGLTGLLADPLNLTMLIPGLGEAVEGSKIAKLAKALPYLKTSPITRQALLKGLAGGVEGAGYGLTSAKLDNTRANQNAVDALKTGGLLGGLLGSFGVALSEHGIESFPGVDKLEQMKMKGYKNTGLMGLTREQRKQVLEDVNPIAPTMSNYYNVGTEYINTGKSDYKKVDKIFDEVLDKKGYPQGAVKTSDIKKAMVDAILKDAKEGGLYANTNKEDVENYVAEKLKNLEFSTSLNPQSISPAFKDLVGDVDVLKIVPISKLGSVLGALSKDIGGLRSKNPLAEKQMALLAHEGIVENILNGGKSGASDLFTGKIPKMNGSEIVEDASGMPVLQSYNELLAPNTRDDYRLGQLVLKSIQNAPETGSGFRMSIPGLGEFGPQIYGRMKTNYVSPAWQYKLGSLLADNPLSHTLGARELKGDILATPRRTK
jgi:hypothetical protein